MKSLIKILLIAFVLTFAIQLKAQDSTNYEKPFFHTNNLQFIKFSFLNVFEPEPSLQFGYSYPIKGGKMQLQHELAYCFSPDLMWKMLNGDWEDEISIKGFKFRTSLRVYTSQFYPGDSKTESKNYFAIDGLYKHVTITEDNMWVSRMGGSFSQIMDVSVKKDVYAFHFIFGKEVFLFGQENLMLDMYAGLGYRIKTINTQDLPLDIQDNFESPMWYDFSTRQSLPSIMLGMKFGFGF